MNEPAMHRFLATLGRQQWSPRQCVAASVFLVVLASVARLLLPFGHAPFLLYQPLAMIAGLTFGWRYGLLVVGLADIAAAGFFLAARQPPSLSADQISALAGFAAVATLLVAFSDAMRRAFLATDASLQALALSRRGLEAARDEAEAARDAAEAANRAKSAFLANMSHELRTPLSAVIGYSEMLEEEAEDAGQGAMLPDLGKIKSNARHLLSLINDVLDLSKVEANRMDVTIEPVDVAELARDVTEALQPLARQRGNTLRLECAPDAGTLRTDAVKLRQCLFNLIGNAAKFTENGSVTLAVTRTSQAMNFAVADTGIGMTQDQIGRLFARFVQADETTTRRYGGSGLGLALSRAFARLLGGDITVASTQGAGSVFTLTLPHEAAPDAPLDAAASAELFDTPPQAADTLRDQVLVIDDEAPQRELMARFLRRQGFAVAVAPDGLVGLALARQLRPRVILLDVRMPGLDGWTVLQRLKADPDTQPIPVVMVSFVADPATATALGAAQTLAKPVDWTRLRDALQPFRTDAPTTLVVDDDADLRHRLRTVLERDGWTVAEAADGAQALDAVRTSRPSLILLDLTMPVMDGFAFLHDLRALPDCADIPVVVLTARDITEDERADLAHGHATPILRKDQTPLPTLARKLRSLGQNPQPGA